MFRRVAAELPSFLKEGWSRLCETAVVPDGVVVETESDSSIFSTKGTKVM